MDYKNREHCPFCGEELETTPFKFRRALCRNNRCHSKFSIIDEDNFLIYLPVEADGRRIIFDINISIGEPQFTAFRLENDEKLEDVFSLKEGLNPFVKSDLAEMRRLAGRIARGILFK